ncbi:unnamed protein product [Chironomus riparius]|uniref:Uncharacterized protein n=1 Tax=Chironomus riparius TaxID=315576 RepID=A0A9N9S3X4_9DIPT|nr:unnamed protein product [Chironomus riparius]
MRFVFFIVALFVLIALTLATPIIDNGQVDENSIVINDDSDLETLQLGCIPRDCYNYCRRISHIYGKCNIFGNCECYK